MVQQVAHKQITAINTPMVVYLGFVHLAGIVGLPWLFWASWRTHLFAIAFYAFSCIGITGGAHRLWAHRSYNASLPVRTFLMCATSAANQGTIFHWCRDHRVHHKFSETAADPHDASRGFFFAHMGWLLLKKRPEVVAAGRKLDLSDLLADPVVMLQQRLNPWWNVFWCFGVPTLVPVLCWGESLLAAYFVPGVLRYLATLHATWLVNSLAHLCEGGRPYDPKQNPAECKIASFFTMGEGWHNWHHAFPFDYAASELGVSKQWNPTKLFIDACCALGLAGGRKRASDVWGKRREKLLAEAAAKGHAVIDTLSGPPLFKQRDITVG